MKSDKKDLIKRGWIDDYYLEDFLNFNQEELLKLLSSNDPCERSAAASLLGVKFNVNEKIVYSSLVKSLSIEKALYTKLQISRSLEKGNFIVAEYMIGYLGKIGNNQHKKLPNTVSKKKSYPLPRDIIARILGKMDKSNFSVLLSSLDSCVADQITELLDAIGFMVFYNPNLAILENLKPILGVLDKHEDNILIVWKVCMVLSAFPLDESVFILNKIKFHYGVDLILLEVERSLNLINGD